MNRSTKISIVIGSTVVVAAIVAVVLVFVLRKKSNDAQQVSDSETPAVIPILPKSITYKFKYPDNQITETVLHNKIDIRTDIQDALDGFEDDEIVIGMYKTSKSPFNYTVLTQLSGGFKLYYLNAFENLMYEPIRVNSIEQLSSITTMTRKSDTNIVNDVTITLQY